MKKLKVIIGIPAYNEQNTIANLLKSILLQKEVGFTLNKIIVAVDESTDDTVKQIRAIKSSKIAVFNDGRRVGKTIRINQLIKKVGNNDVLLILDADILLESTLTIANLIAPFQDRTVGMTNGILLPKNNNTFIERSIITTLDVYENYLTEINQGNNIYAVKGSLMAISRKLSNSVEIPEDVYANDTYLYLACISKGLRFVRVPDARAWYKIPSTLKDQLTQNSRFEGSSENLKKYFGPLVRKEFSMNMVQFYKLTFQQFISNPIHVSAIFFINLYSKLIARLNRQKTIWQVAESTKL